MTERVIPNVGLDPGVISPTLSAMLVIMALVSTAVTARPRRAVHGPRPRTGWLSSPRLGFAPQPTPRHRLCGFPGQGVDIHFHTTILQGEKSATGIVVPEEVVEDLAAGKRPAVKVTINGYTYRSTVAVMGGRFMVGLSAANRAGAGVAGGDEVDIDIELDTAPREVSVPEDFAAALDAEPEARSTFERLSYSNKSWHVLQVEGAKTDETRQRRIAKSVGMLREGRAR